MSRYAMGAPRSYRLPILAEIEIKQIGYEEYRNQNQVVAMLVLEALEARKARKTNTQQPKLEIPCPKK